MWSTNHHRQATPRQRTTVDSCPYRVQVSYTFRHRSGDGRGYVEVGSQQPTLTNEDRRELLQTLGMQIVADAQADGVRLDSSSLTIAITDVVPLR
jgi:hypothetical protein